MREDVLAASDPCAVDSLPAADSGSDRLATELAARVTFLSEASALLARSPEYEITLQTVARLAAPLLADWCAMYMVNDDGEVERTAVGYADASFDELASRLRDYPSTARSPKSRVAQVLRTGRPDLVQRISPSYLETIAQDQKHLDLLRALRFRSSLVVPIKIGERTAGVVALFSVRTGRFGPLETSTAEELAGRIALAIENARLQREAQQAVRLRDEFLSAAAHDLKNPITAAKVQLQLLERQARRAEPERAREMLARLRLLDATIDKMVGLIDELRDVASLQIGRPLELQTEPTDLVELAESEVEEHRQMTRRHEFVFDADEDELVGAWDRVRLERVLGNLLGNAIKYSPQGGRITVSVTREQADGRDWAVVSVADQGVGIPAEDLPRVFERFHRGANVNGRIAGTGIGLAASHQIVSQHGGTMRVESREGEGSRFAVLLPLG